MSQHTAKPNSHKHSRCRHCTITGRRCRLRVQDPASGLCFRHAGIRAAQSDAEDLTAAFDGRLAKFDSAVEIHDFLARLVVLLAQNRVSTRRAAVFGYLTNQLLRTLHAVELAQKADDEPFSIIIDAPRPDRSSYPDYINDLPRPDRSPAPSVAGSEPAAYTTSHPAEMEKKPS